MDMLLQNHTVNQTGANPDEDTAFLSVLNAFHICLGVVITIGNLTVIFVYLSAGYRFRTKTSNLLLCNQAFVDLFQGAVTNGMSVFSKEFLAIQILYQFSMTLSLHTIVITSAERYMFIMKPFFHRKHITTKRVRYAVISTWFSALILIPFRLGHLYQKQIDWKTYAIYYIAITDAMVGLIVVLVTYSYVATYKVTKTFIRRTYERNRKHLHERINKRKHIELESKYFMKGARVTRLYIFMFVAFTISYIPVFVSGIAHICLKMPQYTPIIWKLMSLDFFFYLLNCLFNPIMSLMYKDDYNRHLRKVIHTGLLVFQKKSFDAKIAKKDQFEAIILLKTVDYNAIRQKRFNSPYIRGLPNANI